mgnify:CR=1 FL=1|jgi:phospholipid/cholesterol/gamma-HCH transport system ATP-binding protein
MISLHNVSKSFDNINVINDVSLQVIQGRNTVIMGRSGAGKSVLLKLILRLLEPDSGEIKIDNLCLNKISKSELNQLRLRFGTVFQSAALFDSMSVADNVGIGLRFLKRQSESEINKKVNECLDMVELNNIRDKYPMQLSGGMRKRVGLARAVAMDPEFILYDEPTTGLDPVTSRSIAKLIRKLQNELNVTSVIVSHDLQTIFNVADKVILLNEGKFCFNGTVEAIKSSDNPIVMEFISDMISD